MSYPDSATMPLPSQASLALLTVTWSADLANFELLRYSLELSPFKSLGHHVIVQSEDCSEFQNFQAENMHLYPSSVFLPAEVETHRRSARRYRERYGRNFARICSSISRELGWPNWVRYLGWQTQQLSKLNFIAQSEYDYVLILDSDVIVSPHLDISRWQLGKTPVCLQTLRPLAELRGKVRNWVTTSHNLFDLSLDDSTLCDVYFDTPFIVHAPTLKRCLEWLERRYHMPWWQKLISLAPRRWSEFSIYKTYLRHLEPAHTAQWCKPDYITAISGLKAFDEINLRLSNTLKSYDFVTVHSQNSGRQRWDIRASVPQIKTLLANSLSSGERS